MEPVVLCAQMDQGRMMRLSFLAASMGIRFREIARREGGCTLGMLCGLDPIKTGKSGTVSREIMIMAFFPEELMDRWLQALRNAGESVALKAVLTPYNRHWTIEKLARELQAEHTALNAKK